MNSPASSVKVPSVHGKYRPIFELGRGGMATVFLAVVQGPGGFNKLQVVKQLRDELAGSPEFLAMFLDEARLSARINHSNVVQTNEVGHDGKHYFIAMEYLEGQSFEAVLRRAATKGGLPLTMFLRIVCDALDGLHHAHELADFDGTPLNVVHRDVSPQNIFVTYEGLTKVLDFGIAKAADSSGETRTGVIKGKVAYMAPEQLKATSGRIDRRADIYSVGVMLWRAVTGKRLWKGMSDLEIFQHLAAADIPSPTSLKPDADPRLVAIVNKAMASDFTQRYVTCAEMREDLDGFLATQPPVSTRDIGKFVNELFAAHRAEVKLAVETRLRAERKANPEVPVETMEIPVLDNVVPGHDSSPSRSGMSVPALLETGPGGASKTLQNEHPPSQSGLGAPPPSAKKNPFLLAGAVALGSVVVAVLLVLSMRPAPVKVGANLSDPTAGSGEKVAPLPTIDLTVRVTPPFARVFVDDEPYHASKGQFPRDAAKHWVRAEAVGYATKAQLVPFNVPTLAVQIDLEKKRADGLKR